MNTLKRNWKKGIWVVALCLSLGCAESIRYVSGLTKTDIYTQVFSSDKYDFLWVFDNSGSMADKRDYVKDQMNVFLGLLNSRKAIDYQMAMTTTDFFTNGGTLVETGGLKVVRSSSGISQAAMDFSTLVNAITDSATSFWEQGLRSAEVALTNHSSELLRPNVPLIVIFLSDEEDYSCQSNCFGVEPENNPNWVPYSVSHYIDFFKNFKGSSTETLLFPIVGTEESTCGVDLGSRYIEVQEGSGTGQKGSICSSDLPTSYQNIARFIADIGVRFPLSSQSSGEGFVVFVDGEKVPQSATDGYSYESSTNSIVFAGSWIPPLGATIEIIYPEQKGA